MSPFDKEQGGSLGEAPTRFETMRRALLDKVVAYTQSGVLDPSFQGEFQHFFEEIQFNLVRHGQDFYAVFTQEMKKEVDFHLSWPLAAVAEGGLWRLLINPISFLFCSEREVAALLRHEIFHLMLDHPARAKALSGRLSPLAISLAMDVAVNQHLTHLPAFCPRLAFVNRSLDLDLKLNEPLESYAQEIEAALAEKPEAKSLFVFPRGIELEGAHAPWQQYGSDGAERQKDALHRLRNRAEQKGLPQEMQELVRPGGGQIPWQKALHEALYTQSAGLRKTVARRNRRQPDRLDLKGELRDHAPKVVVALDVSASITKEHLQRSLAEIFPLARALGREMRLIQCDDVIRSDRKVKSLQKLPPLEERRGATAFSPVFERLALEGEDHCLLIYFTDGAGEQDLTVVPRHHTLWVITGESLSLRRPYGRVIVLGTGAKGDNHTYGLQAMRELLHEWAR
ncbi:hypothetical protein ABB02_01663 [Clostridiaceae bacterium JG1575]|nr:hypothetical protein ABB02_01663 [Clostridiaceae bacterium JG1575]